MNIIRSFLLGVSLIACGSATAAVMTNFNQDHMITTNYGVMIHSPFDTQDHITSYSEYGSFQWDVTMNTKIISMKLKDGLLFVFSGSRISSKTYLTCIDPVTGIVLWERP